MAENNKKNKKYNEATLRTAVENVLEKNMTVYHASKEFGIPWLLSKIMFVVQKKKETKE